MSASVGPGAVPYLAYLTSQYPATSHTFISREVAAMRRLGVKVDTFSIRRPSSAELHDPLIEAEASTTFYVLGQRATRFFAAHVRSLLSGPSVYLRTLIVALHHRPPGLKGLALSLAHFIEACLLACELKRRGVTHLHNHFANSAATVGYLASRLLRMRWSFTIHGISETDYPAGLLLGRKIEAADLVICVSYFGCAQAMRLVAPEYWHKLHVVHCGLRHDELPSFRKTGGSHRIICVGRLSPEKGQAGLLGAFTRLAADHKDSELIFVGDGPLSTQLRCSANECGLAGRISFLGRLGEHETLREIACADMLVLPSFMEGLPIVLMEAMAVGTPVIATRVAGIPELVQDGENGLLFTAANWAELTECMRRLLGDPELCKRLAESGRIRVSEAFDVDRSAKQLFRLFESND